MNGEDLWQLTNHRLEQSNNSFSIDVSPADIFVTVIDILVNGDLLFIIQTELYYTPYHYLSRINKMVSKVEICQERNKMVSKVEIL